MYAKKILFPTDLSSLSNRPLELATILARDMKARLIILHIQEVAHAYGGGELLCELPDAVQEKVKELLNEIVPDDRKVEYEHQVATGEAAEEIVHCAKTQNVDLIVMSTHGRSGLGRLLMGSVAETVSKNAPCPVIMYKEPQK